ncbi:MAG: hypothetical protein OQK05_09270 [Pseudopelagicola sp.]|nr:hypothetical protein [Pseudopelagicola sp.]
MKTVSGGVKEIGLARNDWHILRDDTCLTLTRHLPVRFDVCAETVLPDGARLRLARQVRQDLWRRLQGQRGFSPVVEVAREGQQCRLRAGGRIEGRFAKAPLEAEIAALLADPAHRARWAAYAAHREVRHG